MSEAKIDRRRLFAIFETLDDAMTGPQRLCLIGAAAVLCFGHSDRQTEDIDVWRSASTINDRQLASASKTAEMEIDRGQDTIKGPYLQIIDPGIVSLPGYEDDRWKTGEKSDTIWRGNRLTVETPPPAIIVAAKLVRAEERDLDDCMFIIRSKQLAMTKVERAIKAIENSHARETALENLVLLEVANVFEPKDKSSSLTPGRR